ncbi:alpha/beta fold hydrolase, partial [Nonomuraea wenchangensis]
LLTLVARHYEVPAPRLRVPVALVRRLPSRLTRTDPETLTFLSEERYPTGPAAEFAARHGLDRPDTAGAIRRWADELAAHRFGEAPEDGRRRFTTVGGVRTFELGPAGAPAVVLPGLPVNADTWAGVAAALGDVRVADLPGLGLSGGGPGDWGAWMAALVAGGVDHVVAHSIGAAAALEAGASGAPGRLTLVAPFFLQPRTASWAPATRLYLRRAGAEALARRLTGDPVYADALRTSAADLRRPGVAARVAHALAAAGSRRWRADLRERLRAYEGRLHVIVGDRDPLTPAGQTLLNALPHARVTVIRGAGHHPQLTHPEELAHAISG